MLREVFSTELYTILIIVCLTLVAITKLLFTKRFQDFISLLFNYRYLKVYSREQKFLDLFEGLLFINLIIGLAIFTLISLNLKVDIPKTEYLLLTNLAFGFGVILISKILLERIISSILDMNSLIENYIFKKVSYKNFLGLLLIPINILLVYTVFPLKISVTVFITFLIIINVFGIFIFIKNNLKTIKKSWFYFILYLCALEISPYLVLYKIYTLQ